MANELTDSTYYRFLPGREPRSPDDRREERSQVLPERQPAGRGVARDQLPDRSGTVRVHRRAERVGQEHAALPLGALDRPTSGEILVEGQDLVTMSESSRTPIAATRSASSSSRST